MADVIPRVCSIARDFYYGNKSVIQLLKESGYLGHEDSITKDELMKHLIVHPDLIKYWDLWSANKRTSEGWYFFQEGSVWIVGYLDRISRHRDQDKERKYISSFEACAFFIICELKQIAGHA